jgi:hypothetical protein
VLIIEVFNDKTTKQLARERELISKWILNLNNNNNISSSLFNYKNKYLNQQLIFTYKFECSKSYHGVDCLSRKC